jgi:hypothetical protein
VSTSVLGNTTVPGMGDRAPCTSSYLPRNNWVTCDLYALKGLSSRTSYGFDSSQIGDPYVVITLISLSSNWNFSPVKIKTGPGIMAQACESSTQKAEARKSKVPSQSGLCYMARSCIKNNNNNKD